MADMTRTADNILTRLWNSYKKEHPNAKTPPQSLKDKADDMAGDAKKEEKKPAPKPKDGIKQEHDEDGLSKPVKPDVNKDFSGNPNSPESKKLMETFKKQDTAYKAEKAKSDEGKKTPEKKREEKGTKVMESAGFKSIEDVTKKMDGMRAEMKKMSPADKKSPAGLHHRKKWEALTKAVDVADKLGKAQLKAINSDTDLSDPKHQKEVKGMEDDILKSLEGYTALGDGPKGMSDTIKALAGKGKALADKLMKGLKGKKAMRVLAAQRGSRTASSHADMVLVRGMIRLAYARPDLRAHVLPLVVDYLASMDK